MIPRLAALSIAEISARTCSGLGVCMERTVFCIVRRPVTTLRLRSDRFTVWRARLAADFVFAIVIKKLWASTLASELRLSTLEGFPSLHSPLRSASGAQGPRAESATIVCSIRASLLPAEQQVLRPYAFVRPRAYRWKLKQKLPGPGSEVLHSRLRRY
jgi:hypothetical protein